MRPTSRARSTRVPSIKAQIVSEGGSSITSLLDLKNKKTDITGTLADVAYLAYAGQLEEMPEPFDQLRGMVVTGVNTMHLLVGRNARVETLRDLKGLRISLGAPGSSTAHITQRMLEDYGIGPEHIHAERIPNTETREPSEQRRRRRRVFRFQPAERRRHGRDTERRQAHSH